MFGIFSTQVEFLIVVLGIVIVACVLMLTCAVLYLCVLRKLGELSENPWDRRKVTLRKYRLLQTNPPRPSSVCLATERVYKWPWQSNFHRSRCNYVTLEGSCFSQPQSADNHLFRRSPSPSSSDDAYKTPPDEGNCRCVKAQPSTRAPLPLIASKAQLSRAPLAQWSTKFPIGEPADIYVDLGTVGASAARGTKERKHRKKHRDGNETTDSETKHDRRVHKKHRSERGVDAIH
uniref:Secreted protein n=1 Tax=Plectus sambesii TaxID=2011161 RepID=A0A914UZQ9_9BILA